MNMHIFGNGTEWNRVIIQARCLKLKWSIKSSIPNRATENSFQREKFQEVCSVHYNTFAEKI